MKTKTNKAVPEVIIDVRVLTAMGACGAGDKYDNMPLAKAWRKAGGPDRRWIFRRLGLEAEVKPGRFPCCAGCKPEDYNFPKASDVRAVLAKIYRANGARVRNGVLRLPKNAEVGLSTVP